MLLEYCVVSLHMVYDGHTTKDLYIYNVLGKITWWFFERETENKMVLCECKDLLNVANLHSKIMEPVFHVGEP